MTDPKENEVSSETVRKASLLVALTASATSAAVYWVFQSWTPFSPSLIYGGILVSLIGWLGFAFSYAMNARHLTTVVIFAIQAATIYIVTDFGSIRAAGSVIFLATVVAAGTFLGRAAIVASLLISIVSLGLITLAEIKGLLHPFSLQVSFISWSTHGAVLTSVAILVYYARNRTREAYEVQIRALEENKRLAQERDRSLEHFTRIFRTSPSPMVAQAAATGKIIDVNPAFERCYGYSKEAVIGKSDRMLWAQPEQRELHLLNLQSTQHAENNEVVGLREDGSRFHAHISSELGNENEDSLVITTITDMTVQNETLRRLRRSEERFSKAFHFSPLNLIITRQSDDTVVEINRADHAPGARASSALWGLPAAQVGPWFTPTGRKSFIESLNEQGYLHAFETTLKKPDGSTIEAKVWAERIEIDEEACILTCIVDTSNEKQREALLRDIAKGMTGQTAHAFFGALTKHMSHALGADMVLIGELSADTTIHTLAVCKGGEAVPDFTLSIAGTMHEKCLHQQDPLVIQGGMKAVDEWPNLGGETMYEASVCQALHGIDGKPIGLLNALWVEPINPGPDLGALMSIFASRANAEMMRLQREREIDHLNDSLELRVQDRTAELLKLNAELDSFAYSVSHDLKSPLRAIDGFTQLLSERLQGRLDPEEQQLMNRVLGSTHRMATLMADLLALARVSQVPMKRERLNLSALAEEIISESSKEVFRPHVRWQVEPGVYGDGDRHLARNVLEHLIGNALKFTRDQAQPLIEFGQKRSAIANGAGSRVFFVRDNGAGFSMDHADKLFKPFQRLHMPSAGFDGTGIGLATVRRIVERHGGVIEGEAQVNHGAEIRFSLSPSGVNVTKGAKVLAPEVERT